MTNLKNYTEIIRSTVKENTFRDTNYRWSVKGINKNSVKLFWSYLEPDEVIIISVVDNHDTEEPDDLKITFPGGDIKTYVVVGNDRYCDAGSMDEAIVMAIRSAFVLAHHHY